MLFVKTDELNEVVLSHTDPMDPEYGLGKTEEELRTEGYLFEFLEELPRPIKKEGFRGVTYCDGEKFWFEYKETGQADMQELMLRLEEVRTKDVARKKEMEQIRTMSDGMMAVNQSIIDVQARIENDVTTTKTSVEGLTETVNTNREDLGVAMELAELAEQRAATVDVANTELRLETEQGFSMQGERITMTEGRVDIVDTTVSESLMEVMMTQMQVLETDGRITETNGIVSMTEATLADIMLSSMMNEMALMEAEGKLTENEQKLLATESELVTTKEELGMTKARLEQSEADIAQILLMIAGGATG